MSKQKSYSNEFKMKVLEEMHERQEEKFYKTSIAKKYGIPLNTLTGFIKNETKIAEDFAKNKSSKRAREPGLPDVDKAVLRWFEDTRNNKIQVDGLMVKAKAEEFARKLGNTTFKASDGWPTNWKKRNEVLCKTECGESGSVNPESAAQWMLSLDPILQEYDASQIFNADETGLYYKCEPQTTLAFKNDPCFGGKRSKDRLSILVGANMVRLQFSFFFFF